jgi:hypothetical protein
MVDVAVVYPCSRAYVVGGSAERGSAAKVRQRDKHRKFDECARREGVPFFAFVLEGFGLVGEEAMKFLDLMISNLSTMAAHDIANPNLLRPNWLRTIAFALQRGNGAIVAEGVDMNLGRR